MEQINDRVKGWEQLWWEGGVEALLQWGADDRSDDEPREDFWPQRQAAVPGQRRYHLRSA